jgi:hypothetical protein
MTGSSMSKKRARGEYCWEMQVIACGGGCCAPLQDRHQCKGKIEQGHIVAEAEGGGDNPDNLIPLCENHNRRNKKSKVPDNRPAGWRERFIELLAHDVQPRFCVPPVKNGGRQHVVRADVENTEVIAWPKPDLGAEKSLYYSAVAARRDAVNRVEKLIDESQKVEPRLYPPGERQSTQLRTVAEAYPATFELLVREFFKREDYVLGGWSVVCEKPERYERWALERKRRDDEQTRRRLEMEAQIRRKAAESAAEEFALSKQRVSDEAKENLSVALRLAETGYGEVGEFVAQLGNLLEGIEAATSYELLSECRSKLEEISTPLNEVAIAAF